MDAVATSGCGYIDHHEELNSSIVAPARSAIKRSASGVIALSWRPMSAHDGTVFQAAAVVGSAPLAAAAGRCAAHMIAAVFAERSAQKASWNMSLLMETSTSFSPNGGNFLYSTAVA